MSYHIDPNKVLWRNIDGETIVLNLDNGHYYSLNKTGTFVWTMIEEKYSLEEIILKVVKKFHIVSDIAKEDVTSLVKVLLKEGLLTSPIDQKGQA